MKTKYVEGAGLFRLIAENLTRSESEDVKKQIEAHEHGVSTQWARDVDTIDDVTPIEGTYKVWQRIMRSVGMREEIHESTQPYDEHEQMRVLRTQFRDRFDDLNAKVNIFIIIGGVLAWLLYGAVGACGLFALIMLWRWIGMREEIHESTQPYDEHEQMRVLRTQFRDRFDDLNAKVNIFIIIGGVLAWLGIGAYWYNVAKFTGLESACLMLVVALAIMTLAWLWCINHTCDTR